MRNSVALSGCDAMKVGFKVKYGFNEIEIPITENTRPSFKMDGMTDLWKQKVTIYNENIVNAVTVISKDVDRYKPPLEYAKLPVDIREDFYTVQVGDFIVLSEVDDIVTTSREFAELQEKYKDNGIVVRSVSANIHGMSVDNITIANVG